jgi:hypothetical protein
MAKKVIRTQNSDGTWSETTERKGGCGTYFLVAFAVLFVIAIAVADPWMWAIYGVLLVIAVAGGLENARRNGPRG